MNIVIFEDLTTESALVAIEAESAKYDGLYVDMDDDKQRKFVKGKAVLITDLLKDLEVARIKKAKDYRINVESEAKDIKERLEAANTNFTALIDAHKKKRADQLAKEKAIQGAKDLAIQIEEDHGDAITVDKMRTFEIEEEKRQKIKYEEEMVREATAKAEQEKEEAEERAEQAEKDRILAEAKAKRDAIQAKKEAEERAEQAAEDAKQAEIQRQADEKAAQEAAQRKLEADTKHAGAILGQIKIDIMNASGIDEPTAKKIVNALRKMKLVKIIY